MREYPGIGKRGFLSLLRDDVRKAIGAIGLPAGGTEAVKVGVKVGAKVLACLVAAHELQTHASRLLGEAVGEIVIRERDEDEAAKESIRAASFERGRREAANEYFESGRLLGHVEGCAWRREVVPVELQEQIRKLQAVNGWRGPVMVFEDQDNEPTAGVDTPWKTVEGITLADEQEPEAEPDEPDARSFTFAVPGPRAAAGDAG